MGCETYLIHLQSAASDSFYALKAAQSVDLNVHEKLTHDLKIEANIDGDWHVAAIVGNSGSGKTTLAKKMFDTKLFEPNCDECIIDQFPNDWDYDQRANALCGMGLASVPCWIRPLNTLSTGQQARAFAALKLAHSGSEVVVLDEWTSTVDRTIAMIMSERLAKYARAKNKKVVVCACHFDILAWLNPDWMIDCNKSEFVKTPKFEKKNLHSNCANVLDANGRCLANIII